MVGWRGIRLVVWRTNEDETPVKRYSKNLHVVSELRGGDFVTDFFRGGA